MQNIQCPKNVQNLLIKHIIKITFACPCFEKLFSQRNISFHTAGIFSGFSQINVRAWFTNSI